MMDGWPIAHHLRRTVAAALILVMSLAPTEVQPQKNRAIIEALSSGALLSVVSVRSQVSHFNQYVDYDEAPLPFITIGTVWGRLSI